LSCFSISRSSQTNDAAQISDIAETTAPAEYAHGSAISPNAGTTKEAVKDPIKGMPTADPRAVASS
jgi:hypothetical protein